MEYLGKHSNTSSILTTHYIDVCTKLNENPKVANYHMKITNENNHFKYTYRLFEGISKIKGGVQVLKDMDYPEEIINALQKE
jgi:DNA mismatch repair ATPase MutS